jgi:uncharacterized membrane protein
VDIKRVDGVLLLVFSVVFFLQFAGLGLLKLRKERDITGRNVDIIRLLLNSLGLLVSLYAVFNHMHWDKWTGAAFVAGAVLHIGLVRIGWKWKPEFTHDLLALLVGALTFASLALPVQLDGAWVSLGWGIEGVILCWFALRAGVPLLQLGAFLLGGIGLLKSVLFDIQFYDATPRLFLNARFISGILSAALLGAQGVLHSRRAKAEPQIDQPDLWKLIPSITLLGTLLVFTCDIFWTLGAGHTWAWLLSSIVVAFTALAGGVMSHRDDINSHFSRLLLLLVPAMLVIAAIQIADIERHFILPLFINLPFLLLIAMVIAITCVSRSVPWIEPKTPPPDREKFATILNIVSLVAGMLIVTRELYRMKNGWEQTAVTMWWAGSAIALVVAGLIRNKRAHRYTGLWLFGAVTAKVMLVDLPELEGLERIAAFMGTGILLLVLSFVYQRAAARLAGEQAS